MARHWHMLVPNRSGSRPQRHLFVDVESHLIDRGADITEHRLRFGWCCYWRRRHGSAPDQLAYVRFDSLAEFWDLVASRLMRTKPLYLIAHNVQYDLGVLCALSELKARGYRLRSLYFGGLTCILSLEHPRGKLVVLDNCNYFPGKLSILGKTLGYPKLDVNPLTAGDAKLDPYCRRDVEIMVKAWQQYYQFLDDHDLGKWSRTGPGQAFNAYRHRFMEHPIAIHADDEALELERAAYHGGRCSVWFQGELRDGPYYKLDVNSMYPYVMAQHEYPSALLGVRSMPSLMSLRGWLEPYALVARCIVDTPEPYYPVRQTNHVVYPVGRFEVALTTPELRHALEHGHLESCLACALYKKASLFTTYVKYFHELKTRYEKEGNSTYRYMTKRYLNSLYGKFGQLQHNWIQFGPDAPDVSGLDWYYDGESDIRYNVYHIMGEDWGSCVAGEAPHSFPAIAAHVTAYARDYLWTLRRTATSDHVYYCDTDSLIVDQVGYDNLRQYLDPDRLGGLKVEGQGDTVTIQSPKVYAFGEDWKRKGIRKDALQVSADTWEQDKFPSLLTQFRWPEGTPFHTIRVQRKLTGRIYDGVVGANGRVTPLPASALHERKQLTPEESAEVAQLLAQIDALQEAIPVDPLTVLRLWDYRKGTWKHQRDRNGKLVPIEYSSWDSRATELGFEDLTALQEGVIASLQIRRQIRQLSARIATLRREPTLKDSSQDMPF